MGVLVFVVPVLLVVVLGYAIGYTAWEATGLGGDPANCHPSRPLGRE